MVSLLLILLLDLFLQCGVVLALLLGDLDHHVLDVGVSVKALFELADFQGVDLGVFLTDGGAGAETVSVEESVVVAEVAAVGVDGHWDVEALLCSDEGLHVEEV